MNRKIILLLILGCCCIFNINAQELGDTSIHIIEEQDTNREEGILSDTLLDIHAILIPPDTIAAIKNSKRFAYAKNLDSLLKDWQKEVAGSSTKLPVKGLSFFDKILNAGVLKMVLWAIVILFVVYILYNLFLSKGIFIRRPANKKANPAETEEAIFEKADYEALLRQAYAGRDYRMAVRYQFLKTLQRLNQHSLISFAADKTNSAYVYELPGDKRNNFAALVMTYEYVWYGNIPIDEDRYEKIAATFTGFETKI